MGLSGCLEATVKLIHPPMIGTNEGLAISRLLLTDPSTSVPTNIVHRADTAVFTANHDQRIFAYLE